MLKEAEALAAFREGVNGQVVLVLQGGGALGAYQSSGHTEIDRYCPLLG